MNIFWLLFLTGWTVILSLTIFHLIIGQERLLRQMSDVQAAIDAEVAKVNQLVTDLAASKAQLTTDFKTLTDEIAALKATQPTADFTALDTALANVGDSIHGLPASVETPAV